METVRVNHSFMLDKNAGLGRTVGNPCYEDQMEGVALFAKGRSLFLFNAILNAKHEFLRMGSRATTSPLTRKPANSLMKSTGA